MRIAYIFVIVAVLCGILFMVYPIWIDPPRWIRGGPVVKNHAPNYGACMFIAGFFMIAYSVLGAGMIRMFSDQKY